MSKTIAVMAVGALALVVPWGRWLHSQAARSHALILIIQLGFGRPQEQGISRSTRWSIPMAYWGMARGSFPRTPTTRLAAQVLSRNFRLGLVRLATAVCLAALARAALQAERRHRACARRPWRQPATGSFARWEFQCAAHRDAAGLHA